MPVYFIQSNSVRDDRIALTGDLAHHLRIVLRCKPGDLFDLVDEDRTRYRVSLEQMDHRNILTHILSRDENQPATGPAITLVQSVLKGKKMDWIIQKATELGIQAIVPVISDRTIARMKSERRGHQKERWEKIALGAAQQCGRSDIPSISSVMSLSDFFRNDSEAKLKLILWEQELLRPLKAELAGRLTDDPIMAMVGPEGGFTAEEVERARGKGWVSVSLGSRVLRAETAGLVVLSILQYELGDRGMARGSD